MCPTRGRCKDPTRPMVPLSEAGRGRGRFLSQRTATFDAVLRRMAVIVAVVLIALSGCAKLSPPSGAASASPSSSPPPVASPALSPSVAPSVSPSVSPSSGGPLFRIKPVHLDVQGFWSWAYLDFKTGKIDGSTPVNALSDTASMTKAWIAADYLRRSAEQHKTPNAT